jgi:pseudouridine kinase
MENNILVIGAQNTDIFSKTDQELVLEDSNPAKISIAYGGVGRNIAVNLSRLDFEVHFISVFGDDDFSKSAHRSLKEMNIDTSHSLFLKDSGNSIFMGIIDQHNDMHLGFHDMAIVNELNSEFLRQKIDFINQFDVIVVDNNLSAATINYLVSNFNHKTIIIDAVSALKAHKLIPVLDRISILKVNKLELDALSDKLSIAEQLKDLHGRGAQKILLTQKDNTVFVSTAVAQVTMKPSQLLSIVNASGAGDAFLSGYIFGMMKGYNEEDKIKLANIAAGITLGSNESTSSQLNREILENAINE